MSKWIEFIEDERSASGKTQRWRVVEKGGGARLGFVSWFSRWRKYAFFPESERVFEEQCLRDVANFCEQQTKEHKP